MPANRPTDTQLVILSAASRREDRGIVLPANLKGGVAQKLVAKLIDLGLVEEVRARGDLPVWRRDDDNRPMALRSPSAASRRLRSRTIPTPGRTPRLVLGSRRQSSAALPTYPASAPIISALRARYSRQLHVAGRGWEVCAAAQLVDVEGLRSRPQAGSWT